MPAEQIKNTTKAAAAVVTLVVGVTTIASFLNSRYADAQEMASHIVYAEKALATKADTASVVRLQRSLVKDRIFTLQDQKYLLSALREPTDTDRYRIQKLDAHIKMLEQELNGLVAQL